MHVISSVMAWGLVNAWSPGSAKFANAPPLGLTRRTSALQLPGGGGAGGAGHRWCCCVALVYNTIHIFFRSIFLRKLFNIRFSSGCKENHFYSSPFGQAEANNY